MSKSSILKLLKSTFSFSYLIAEEPKVLFIGEVTSASGFLS
jgi:hypothetical protein